MNAKAAKALRRLAGVGKPYRQAKRAWTRRPKSRRNLQALREYSDYGTL